jgi:hypothetical protein
VEMEAIPAAKSRISLAESGRWLMPACVAGLANLAYHRVLPIGGS